MPVYKVVTYQVKTNAMNAQGLGIWGHPKGPYGVAKCVNWRDHGQLFTAIRWV